MAEISYRRHRFPPVIIQHAVWVYLRFTLSYRDVEQLLAERGLDISYETVRCWVLKFGPVIAPAPPAPAAAEQSLAPGRDGGADGGKRMYSGVLSIMKARCSTCWSSRAVTAGRRCG